MDNPKTWSPQPRPYKSGPFTVEATGYSKVKGETIPRRNTRAKDGLILTPEDGVATLYDILKRSAKNFGNAKAVGSRKVVRTHDEVKKIKKTVDGKEESTDKKWTYFELSEYHYMSYIEYERTAIQCGAGLRKLGMKKDDRLHIFAATTPWWLAMAHGMKPPAPKPNISDDFTRLLYPDHAHRHCIRYPWRRRITALPTSNTCQGDIPRSTSSYETSQATERGQGHSARYI